MKYALLILVLLAGQSCKKCYTCVESFTQDKTELTPYIKHSSTTEYCDISKRERNLIERLGTKTLKDTANGLEIRQTFTTDCD